MKKSKTVLKSGFTIVELLVVIVVIGILAAITIVSYTGISKKATEASQFSDLMNNSKKLDLYYAENNSYPQSLDGNNCPVAPVSNPGGCLKFSSIDSFKYVPIGVNNYNLAITKGNNTYRISPGSSPVLATSVNCPTNYVTVPGSITYGTKDFCVMKYEAKNDGSSNAIATSAGSPWVSIDQATAITKAASACAGCHLITEAEWMTIAQNVLSVPTNWSSGIVGNGYIYQGHSDSNPGNTLSADINDNLGYSGTLNSSGELTTTNGLKGDTQRRTLTLTNGEVIWDLSGNVAEWTSGRTTGGQPGLSSETIFFAVKEWTSLNVAGTLYPDPKPSSTGFVGASTWNSSNGIGHITSNANDSSPRGFGRGGSWIGFAEKAGILALGLDYGQSNVTSNGRGFRVSK